MEPESPGRLIPRVMLPLARQWAQRSGLQLLSQLLSDEQLQELLERYGEQLYWMLAKAGPGSSAAAEETSGNGENGNAAYGNGHGEFHLQAPDEVARPDVGPVPGSSIGSLEARISSLEAEHQRQRNLLTALESKLAPVSKALGCCPDCLVGLDACPTCSGAGTVGSCTPDLELLVAHVIAPLRKHGLPIDLGGSKSPRAKSRAKGLPTKRSQKP